MRSRIYIFIACAEEDLRIRGDGEATAQPYIHVYI